MAMTKTLELPERLVNLLQDHALQAGTTVEAFLEKVVDSSPAVRTSGILEKWIDREFHAECEAKAGSVDRIDEIRRLTAKIPGNWSDDIIRDREDRY